jgi:glycogen operon protein
LPDIAWHGLDRGAPDWDSPDGRSLAFVLAAVDEGEADLCVLLNMDDAPQRFALQAPPGRTWHLAVDTSRPTPEDILLPDEQHPVRENGLEVGPRTVVVLEAR